MPEPLDTVACGFLVFADDGSMLQVNQTLVELLGYTKVELLGWHVEKILPPGARIFYQSYLFPLLKVQSSVEEIYLTLRTKDGHDVPVLLNGKRRERDGRPVSECIVVRMIQRHEYEDQLLQARRLAEASGAAKAKFLSMMSHDLRTPLTTIYGNAQMLAGEHSGPLTAGQREAVQAIAEACGEQLTLITDILEFARLDSGRIELRPQPVVVLDAIERAERIVRVQASEAGLTLRRGPACHERTCVLADAARLQQVLLNLLTNAVKYTPPGGEITVACEAAGDRVRIRVRDTGIGIDPEQLPRIFAPFVQLGSAGSGGVGLGLAISRDLARAMDGEVTAESAPGAGSVFIIDLPAAAAFAPADGEAAPVGR
jgi:PAS domain S-box-containing protein